MKKEKKEGESIEGKTGLEGKTICVLQVSELVFDSLVSVCKKKMKEVNDNRVWMKRNESE